MNPAIDAVRKGQALSYDKRSLSFDPQADLTKWLRVQATTTSWLLAHAADGVIWGWATADELHTSHEVASDISPELRLSTLQTLRLFNPDYEVRLWREGDAWHALHISDIADENAAAIDEYHLLWGTHAEGRDAGFIRLEDGAQGLRHVIPPFAGSENLVGRLGLRSDTSRGDTLTRAHLLIRHYLTADTIGVNRITLSRLVTIGVSHYEQA